MDTDEIIAKSLKIFNLDSNASLQEVRTVYLSKTFQKKFQKVIISDEQLEKEFLNYYEAYNRFLKYHQEEQAETEREFIPSEKIFKLKFNQGLYYFINQKYIKAGEKFQEAFRIDNKHVLLLIYLGIILLIRKNYYAAEKYFTKALEIDKNNEDSWFYLGEIYLQTGQLEKAIKMFKTCQSLNPLREEVAFKLKEIDSKRSIRSSLMNVKKRYSLIKKVFKRFDKKKTSENDY